MTDPFEILKRPVESPVRWDNIGAQVIAPGLRGFTNDTLSKHPGWMPTAGPLPKGSRPRGAALPAPVWGQPNPALSFFICKMGAAVVVTPTLCADWTRGSTVLE